MSAPSLGRNMLVAATVVVVATLLAALWTMESPSRQRDHRLDERRIGELGQIELAVAAWHGMHGRLPASLADVAAQPGASLPLKDPVSGKPYDYAVTSERGYRLCAEFATTTAGRGQPAYYDRDWQHPAGRHCFERKVAASAEVAAQPAR
jgi:hypothetical protein